jgi:hypothetical protein
MESIHEGRSIVKIVVSRFTNAEAWVRSQVNPYWICVSQVTLAETSHQVRRVFPVVYHSISAQYSFLHHPGLLEWVA